MNFEKTMMYLYNNLDFDSEQDPGCFDPIKYEDVGKYGTRVIKSGQFMELELYPIIPNKPTNVRKALTEKEKIEHEIELKKARHATNLKYTWKNIVRLTHANFKAGDLTLVLKYDDEHVPNTLDEVKKDATNYIRRMQRHATKKGWGKLKYLYVASGGYPKKRGTGLTRWHIHMVISGFRNIEAAKDIWGKCPYPHVEKIRGNVERLAKYLAKNAIKTNENIMNAKDNKPKRYGHSKHLTRTWTHVKPNEKKLSLKQVKQIQEEDYKIAGVVHQLYKSYEYTGHKIYGSKYTKGKYIRITMMKKETKSKRRC